MDGLAARVSAAAGFSLDLYRAASGLRPARLLFVVVLVRGICAARLY